MGGRNPGWETLMLEAWTRRGALLGIAAAAGAVSSGAAQAKGNLASKPTELKLSLKGDLAMEPKEFRLETGKYYKLAIDCAGGDEFHWMAPELFTNSWVYQVVISGIEVHNVKSPEIEFDKDGTAIVYFVPVRTGRFKYYVRGHEERGMSGTMFVE